MDKSKLAPVIKIVIVVFEDDCSCVSDNLKATFQSCGWGRFSNLSNKLVGRPPVLWMCNRNLMRASNRLSKHGNRFARRKYPPVWLESAALGAAVARFQYLKPC